MDEAKKEELGIQNIVELLVGIELLGVTSGEIFKDGVDASDFPKLLSLLTNFQIFVDAGKDIDQIIPEGKNISQEEALLLGMRTYTMIKNILEAYKK